MDELTRDNSLTDTKLMEFIEPNLTDFRSYSETEKKSIFERAKQYPKSRQFSAKTSEEYSLHGAQSDIWEKKWGLSDTFFWFDRLSGERNKAVAE
jgi:hypothetical protein